MAAWMLHWICRKMCFEFIGNDLDFLFRFRCILAKIVKSYAAFA